MTVQEIKARIDKMVVGVTKEILFWNESGHDGGEYYKSLEKFRDELKDLRDMIDNTLKKELGD